MKYKEAKTDYDFRKLGKYFSAISNESNMKGRPCGWLVFGVNDDRKIVGTQYRSNSKDLDNLKHESAIKTSGGLTFMDIHELILPEEGCFCSKFLLHLPVSYYCRKATIMAETEALLLP
ncbi:ATP-binding protein [Paenibacillus sp. JTLBN-2024]